MRISAAIPVHNAAATLPRALASVRAQAPGEMIVIDDGSTDALAPPDGARLIALGANLGRGAARARALADTDAALVLMCDATLELPPDFLARALPWFDEPRTAAVFGHVTQPPPHSTADRWRGRHLFKAEPPAAPRPDALLATGACVLRAAAVREVGGFDPTLRSGEDADLGRRLLAAGWRVVADPALHALCIRADSPGEALARYARWNSPAGLRGRAFLRQLAYAVKVMAAADLRAGDPLAALLSLASPFYQLRRR